MVDWTRLQAVVIADGFSKTRVQFHSFACGCSVFPGEGNGIPLQYFCLENPMDGGAW